MNSKQSTPPRFDWYSGSFEPSKAISDLLGTLIDENPRACRPRNGYEKALELRRDGCVVARVMSGSKYDWHYIEASGEDSVDVSNLLRTAKVPHTVSRADACTDVTAATAFADFETKLLAELPADVTRTQYAQTRNGETAATLYLGSRKSEAFARVYEKGKESPDTHHADTVRLEVQARPHGANRKRWAATATPHEIMSLPGWSSQLLGLVELDRLPPPPRTRRVSDLEGALTAMGQQYRRRVLELVELHEGDLEGVWEELQGYLGLTG